VATAEGGAPDPHPARAVRFRFRFCFRPLPSALCFWLCFRFRFRFCFRPLLSVSGSGSVAPP